MRSLRVGDVLERYPRAESLREMAELGLALRPMVRPGQWEVVPLHAREPLPDWRETAREFLESPEAEAA